MKNRIIYVPLDERECNYNYPYELGINAKIEIIRPPKEMLSRVKQPADVNELWQWLYTNAEYADYAILSLDMLVYGGILNSRHHQLTADECLERMEGLAKLKNINPSLEVHAFILIMRVANYNNNSEEPEYWENYGKKIWKYSYLYDKKSKMQLEGTEEDEWVSLQNIPSEFLIDYTERRSINLKVNLNALEMIDKGLIDYLVIPKDDTSEFGFSTIDQDTIFKKIYHRKLYDKVFVYPGTDEVGCTLTSRVINKVYKVCPKVFISYSSIFGGSIIAKYEDRPIHECIKWQLLSAGCIIVDDHKDADFILMVNTPGKYMLESNEQGLRDYTYVNFRNVNEFVEKIKYYTSLNKKCVVADVAYANGADNQLMHLMLKEKVLDKIWGYGAWNTSSNTLGVVILQGCISLLFGEKKLIDNTSLWTFHLKKIIEDWAYQANVLWYFVDIRTKQLDYNPYKLSKFRDCLLEEVKNKLNEYINSELLKYLPINKLSITYLKSTWDRLFDLELHIELE